MRDLLYRLPRHMADFPVDIIVGEIAILGVCKDISDHGMRGEFRHRLPLDTEGLIRLNPPMLSMELKGILVHATQTQMSFEFKFQSEAERRKLADFARAVCLVGSSFKTAAPQPRGLRYLQQASDRRPR